MKVLALTKYSYEGPSSRYRFYNYRECFKKSGIDMVIVPFFSKRYFEAGSQTGKLFAVIWAYLSRLFFLFRLLFKKDAYVLVLIEYELFPYFPAWFEYLLKRRGIRYIVDYDDAIFHKYDMHRNPLLRYLFKDKIAKVMRYADAIIACNGYLENYARKYNNNIVRLPTVVLLDRYLQKMEVFQREKEETFVIGWIGSRTTSVYILEILPVLKRFVESHPNVHVDLVGFDRSLLSDDEIRRYHINIIPWSEEKEIENILAFDVGIMPLHDDPWSRGKCGFKLIQYMSCKKPVIASPVGVNVDVVEDGVNGFLVSRHEEWSQAFEKLYDDKVLRREMAENNFTKIMKEFNPRQNCIKYVTLIEKTVKM